MSGEIFPSHFGTDLLTLGLALDHGEIIFGINLLFRGNLVEEVP